jgi:hypothetical protein
MTKSSNSHKRPIGDIGEDFVEQICEMPFGKDFLFRGQQYRTTHGDVELCDLLLLFDDTAVLMEVKTARRDKKKGWTDEQWSDWANKRLTKALDQMKRGCTALLAGEVKQVENQRQGVVLVDPSRLKHVFGIVVVDHPTLDKYGKGPSLSVEGRTINVLTTTHEELQHLLIELSTVGDFVDYMQAREVFFTKNMMMGITELDLLAVYKGDPKEFKRKVAKNDFTMTSNGTWEVFSKREARDKRVELDKYSYVIDAMLDILHESQNAMLPHIEERRNKLVQNDGSGMDYVTIASELARFRRLGRRSIGNTILEKSRSCVEQNTDRWFAIPPNDNETTAFVFLVSINDRAKRMESLELVTWGGKLKMQARRVIGIATEPITGGYGFSVDAILVDQDPEHDRQNIPLELQQELQAQFGTPRQIVETEFGGSNT